MPDNLTSLPATGLHHGVSNLGMSQTLSLPKVHQNPQDPPDLPQLPRGWLRGHTSAPFPTWEMYSAGRDSAPWHPLRSPTCGALSPLQSRQVYTVLLQPSLLQTQTEERSTKSMMTQNKFFHPCQPSGWPSCITNAQDTRESTGFPMFPLLYAQLLPRPLR